MPVIFQSGGGQDPHFIQRIELAGFYLNRAYRCAKQLRDNPAPLQDPDRLEKSILTVIWSSLALEAGANSLAEDIIPTVEFRDFEKCRKKYRKTAPISSIVWKWHLLFQYGPKKEMAVDSPTLKSVEELAQLRHRLTHYCAHETARKVYFEPPKPVKKRDGGTMMVFHWSAGTKPTRIEPSVLEKAFVAEDPARHYTSARNLFFEWELSNGRDGSVMKGMPEL